MITIDRLKEFGANVDEGLGRCMGSEALYLKLVGSVSEEQNFEKLSTSIEAKDFDAAFEAAHALKGVLGNLSITPLFDKVNEMTELLRARTDMDYTEMLSEILALRDELKKLGEE